MVNRLRAKFEVFRSLERDIDIGLENPAQECRNERHRHDDEHRHNQQDNDDNDGSNHATIQSRDGE